MAKYESLVEICINTKTHQNILVKASDLVIKVDGEKVIKVSDLLTFYYAMNDKINTLEASHNDLVAKYNALLASYKANNAKVALELLETKENI